MKKATNKKVASLMMTMAFMLVFSATSFAQYTFYGDNVIKDGDFSTDTLTSNWYATGDSISIINGELAFIDMAPKANQYDIQAGQSLTAAQISELAKGGTFELTFDARTEAGADTGKTFHVFLGHAGGGWERYWAPNGGDGDITVTPTMTEYTLTTEITETWDAMNLAFEVSTDTADLYIDNIVLRRKVDNVVLNGAFSTTPPDSGWTTEVAEGNTAQFDYSNNEVAITGISAGNSYSAQAYQNFNAEQLDSLAVGPYVIEFDARTEADSTKEFVVYFGENIVNGGWTNFAAGKNPTVTDSMISYSIPVNVTEKWSSMKLGFEVGSTAASVYIDNVVLRKNLELPPAEPTFALSTDAGVVTIDITASEGAAFYDVYFSNSAIDTLDKAGVSRVGVINADSALSLTHSTEAPHVSLVEEFDAHYTVVARSDKEIKSEFTSASITTSMTIASNYAAELSASAIETVLGAITDGTIPAAATLASVFPDDYTPFSLSPANGVVTEASAADDADDISLKSWIGFGSTSNELIIYTEVTDNALQFVPVADGAAAGWNYDSFEMGLGNYSPASFITGSTHTDMERGDAADYQFRMGLFADSTGYVYENFLNADDVEASETITEITDTGYRTLTLIDTGQLTGTGTVTPTADPDGAWSFPTGEAVQTYPLNFAINDADGTSRETQLAWSSKSSAQWWNTPAEWKVVAFVGSDAVTTSNEDIGTELPKTFSLEQNYPNPFNPSTNISFTLPNASKVTLEVFNVLGQKVATLINNESMTVGSHSLLFDASNLSSGLYIYRISAGSSFFSAKKMMLIK